jgi:hypothetical protein
MGQRESEYFIGAAIICYFLLVEEAGRQQSAPRLQSAFLILRSDMQIALKHELLFLPKYK